MTAFEQEPGVGSSEGPGRRLRLAREKRRLSITEVGDALHLERGVVQALEDDDYEALPPATFTKGYLRSYARFLELDEEAVLKSFRQVANREAERPLTAQVGRESRTGGGGGTAGWVVLVLVVVLAGGGWLVWSRGGDVPPWADALLRGGEQVLDGGGSLVGADGASGGDAASPAGGEATGANDTMDTLVEAAEPETPAAGDPAAGEGGARDSVGTADVGSDTIGGEHAASPPDDGAAGGDASDTAASTAVNDSTAAATSGTTADAAGGGSGVLDTGDGDFGGPLSEAAPEPGLQSDEPAAAAAGSDPGTTPSMRAGDGGTPATAPGAGDDALASAGTRENSMSESTGESTDVAADGVASAGADAPAPTGGDRAPAGDRETLVFTFTGESWMEVRDARGRRLLFGLVSQAGERRVSGVPPFDIVVGDVGRVSVAYKGDPVDLSEYTRGSVARLTLGNAQ